MVDKDSVRIFLDSGAFSIEQGNAPDSSIDAYIKYLESQADNVHIYANFDVLSSEEKTYENQKLLESYGLSPLPVVHTAAKDEAVSYLGRYVEEGYNYIAIGASGVGLGVKNRPVVLDKMFQGIPDDVRIHGFGVGDWDLIERYPWHSVDSASIVKACGVAGAFYIPRVGVDGAFDYTKAPATLHLDSSKDVQKTLRASMLSSSRWQSLPTAFDALPFGVQDTVTRYLQEVGGLVIGASEYRIVPSKDVKSKYSGSDFRVVAKSGPDVVVRRIRERGVTNFYICRYRAALHFTKRFADYHNVIMYFAGEGIGVGATRDERKYPSLLAGDVYPRNILFTFAALPDPDMKKIRGAIKRHLKLNPTYDKASGK